MIHGSVFDIETAPLLPAVPPMETTLVAISASQRLLPCGRHSGEEKADDLITFSTALTTKLYNVISL
jgi:hypothetical protein